MEGEKILSSSSMSGVQIRKRAALAQGAKKTFTLRYCLSASLDLYRDLDQ
jgi:hypothetical protein